MASTSKASFGAEDIANLHSLSGPFGAPTLSSGTMEEAQRIIENVRSLADNVCVNKNQCKRLAERFGEMGKALESASLQLEESTMAQILLVLKKGETLVLDYKEPANALRNVLNRAENYATFKVIHEQIDDLRTYLYLPTPKNHLDRDAADTDLQVMGQNLNNLKLDGVSQVNMRNVEKVVFDKCSQDSKAPDDNLSYLHIQFSEIKVGDPIKPLPVKLNAGDKHLEGQALVHHGRWNGCECAIKVFKSSALHWNTEELQKEVASLVKLRHPHITQLIGCAQNEEKTYVLYEKMDGDLRTLMKKKTQSSSSPFSRAEEVSIITQIAHGMFYLHEQNYVHGELKCTNLLVKQAGGNIDVKVSDFHCSRELGQIPRDNAKYRPTHRVRWLPPEAFDHYNVEQAPADEVLKQGDVYSFAMTCYEVVTGGYPFDGIPSEVLKKKILAGERPTLPAYLSDDLKKLIQKCWAANPEKRPNFEEICYVLQVIDATRVPTLFACFGFGNPRVADEVESEWSFDDVMGSATEDVAKDLPHYLQIDPANLKPIQQLGKGASAEVFAASWLGCKFAVKWLKSGHVLKLQHEVGIMVTLLHPHVVRLVGFSVMARANRCAIVMELMEKSLREFMDEKVKARPKPFSETEALQIITKLALGMDFLHSRGVAHGDLKCANVMVRNVKAKNNLVVKLVDFGLSHLESKNEKKPSLVGPWRAPEVIVSMESHRPVPYDPKLADVFSFGMMCLEVITGKKPYHGMKDSVVKELVKGDSQPKELDSIKHGELKKLLKDCWRLEPKDRPTFPTICKRLHAMS